MSLTASSDEELPNITEAPPHERVDLFLRKLKQCEKTYDFSDPRAQFSLKETKRRNLLDVANFLSSRKGVLNARTYRPFIDMVGANIFRALPLSTLPAREFEQDDTEIALEPAWPHLQVVYELLRKFVVSGDTDSRQGRAVLTVEFVTALVGLFASEDPREREYLKTILHRIYGKVMPLRAAIRTAIMNVFHRVVYEGQFHTGIGELLEILGSIINGFAVPLKEEHKMLLRKGLLPLHIPAGMPAYHVQLSFCVTQFVEKDAGLAGEVVRSLVKHWPVSQSRKEVMLLNEIEEVIELAPMGALEDAVAGLFRRVGRCIESAHFQVAERALFYWNNEGIVRLMVGYREIVVGEVVGALQRNIEGHWNANVHSLSTSVQNLLREMDEELFDRCMDEFEERRRNSGQREAERARRWHVVSEMARQHQNKDARRKKGLGGDKGGKEEGKDVVKEVGERATGKA